MNEVVVAGCGEGKDPRLAALGVAILIAVGVVVTGKLNVPPPPTADESKLGVLGGTGGCT